MEREKNTLGGLTTAGNIEGKCIFPVPQVPVTPGYVSRVRILELDRQGTVVLYGRVRRFNGQQNWKATLTPNASYSR